MAQQKGHPLLHKKQPSVGYPNRKVKVFLLYKVRCKCFFVIIKVLDILLPARRAGCFHHVRRKHVDLPRASNAARHNSLQSAK